MDRARVQDCFERTRSHYKGGVKSSNKKYFSRSTPTDKHSRRASNQSLANNSIGRLREHLGEDLAEYGEKLLNLGTTIGNCMEMACYAIPLLREACPYEPLWTVQVPSPGDHFFVAIGERPRERINRFSGRQTMIVDPWLNTCCDAADYQNRYETKLDQWSLQRKRIADSVSERWVKPSSTLYKYRMATTDLIINDAYLSYIDLTSEQYALPSASPPLQSFLDLESESFLDLESD